MAAGNVIFAVLAALVVCNFISAEENPLELSDFAYDQVSGNENHGPPSNGNDNEKKQEETNSPLFHFSARGTALAKKCNVTRGPDYCMDCKKAVHCLTATSGIITICYDILPYCNKGKCSDKPGIECKSG